MAGLFGNFDLEGQTTNPLFLGGAALLSGEGFKGAVQGMQAGGEFQDRRRKQQEAETQKQRWNEYAQSGMGGLTPEMQALVRAAGPQGMQYAGQALTAAQQQAFQREQQDRQFKQQMQVQGASFGQQRKIAELQHELQIKMLNAKSEMERKQLLDQGRALGIIPPEAPTTPPAAMPAPQPGSPMPPVPGVQIVPQQSAHAGGMPNTARPQLGASAPPMPPGPAGAGVPSQAPAPTQEAPQQQFDPARLQRARSLWMVGNKSAAIEALYPKPDKGDEKFTEKSAELVANQFNETVNAYPRVQADLGKIGIMKQLSASIGQPGIANTLASSPLGRAARAVGLAPEQMASIESWTAMVSQMVPSQRPPGSGTMSDKDVDLFKSSLPMLAATKEGRDFILAQMEGIARYDAERARIANAAITGKVTRQQAMDAMMSLPNPLAGVEQNMQRFGIRVPNQPRAQPTSPGGGGQRYVNPQTGEVVEWNGSAYVSVTPAASPSLPTHDERGIPYPPASR